MSAFQTFEIPTERVAELQERVAKLNRKAEKLGTPAIELQVTDKTQEHTVSVGGTMRLRMGEKFTYTTRTVLLRGETPKLNGWEFLSVVMHRPAGNDFLNVQDPTLDLSEFNFTDKHCDHCRQNRVRNATFLVRHPQMGTILQVGSSCLTDFTGVKSPQAHARQLENIFNLFTEIRGWGSVAGRTTRKFFLAEWMAFVAMTVREQGHYVGRNRAYDTGEATTGEQAKRSIMAADGPVPTDEDWKTGEAAIAWVRTDEAAEKILGFSAEFGKQLLAATASDDDDAVSEDTMNIVASLIAFYRRSLDEAAKPVSTAFLGAQGDKITVTGTVEHIGMYEGDYGVSSIYNVRDAAGNKVTWFSSKHNLMEKGETVTLTGTVKKLDTFRGENITVMTRCKVAS